MTFEELGIKTKDNMGSRYATTCPKCSDERKSANTKKPCLTINNEVSNQWWNCNHCGWSGNLAMYTQYENVYKHSRMPLAKSLIYSKEVTDWLDSKQINSSTAMDWGLYEVEGMKKQDEKWVKTGHQEIAFPYYKNQTLVNVMFRRLVYSEKDGEAKVYQTNAKHGTESCFWGLNRLDLTQPTLHKSDQTHKRIELIITEGQTDALTWSQCNYKNVLSVPMGAPSLNSKNLVAKISFLTNPWIKELLKNVHRIYIAMDGDDAGQAFKEVLAEHLGRQRCYVINYPFGYKDSNEVYAGDAGKDLYPLGQSGIDDLYASAQPYPIKGIFTLHNVKSYLNRLRVRGLERGLLCGEKEVDAHISVKKKLLMVVTGVPGHGKSSWVRWFLVELCRINPTLKFGMYSPESRPPEREFAKLQEVFSKKNYGVKASNSLTDDQLKATESWVAQRFFLVNPSRKSFVNLTPVQDASPKGLASILYYMLHLKNTQGIYGFIIDAWNKIDHEVPKGITEEKWISKQLDVLLDFLEEHDMFAIVVAHPTKMETVKGGNHKIPFLYDIKGSSAWSEKADIGVSIYRKKYKKSNRKDEDGDEIWERDHDAPGLIIVEKMKFDELGMEGRFEMFMDKNLGGAFISTRPVKYGSKTVLTPLNNETEEREPMKMEDLPF